MSGIDRQVALRAAEGWLLLHSGDASSAEQRRWSRWRAADPAHEIAWQRAEALSHRFASLPPALAVPALARPARGDRRAAVRALALLLTAAPAGWLAWRHAPLREWVADQRTATGERRELTLPDGSRIQLNTATAVDIAFDSRARVLRLIRGEVFVATAPDTVPAGVPGHRPFRVETPHGDAEALGTRFLVRTEPDHSRVAVLEGAVRVRPADAPSQSLVLQAGQKVRFDGAAVGGVQPADVQADAWTRGVLYARDMPLQEFAAELGRYRPGLLRCDPAVAQLRVSGAFQLRDTTPVLDSLPQALPVLVRYRTRFWAELLPPEG